MKNKSIRKQQTLFQELLCIVIQLILYSTDLAKWDKLFQWG